MLMVEEILLGEIQTLEPGESATVDYSQTITEKELLEGCNLIFGASTGYASFLPEIAAANPDVAAVLGTDAAILAQHYVTSGKLEGRKPNAGSR